MSKRIYKNQNTKLQDVNGQDKTSKMPKGQHQMEKLQREKNHQIKETNKQTGQQPTEENSKEPREQKKAMESGFLVRWN